MSTESGLSCDGVRITSYKEESIKMIASSSTNQYLFIGLLVIILVSTYLFVTYNQKKTVPLNQLKNTNNMIILWDLHEVVFQRSIIDWAKEIITFDGKWQAIKKTSWPMYKLFFKYFLYVLGIQKGDISSEELIVLAKQQGNDELVRLTVTVGSHYKPITKTVEIIKDLHNHGYKQHVGSNIGRTIYNHFSNLYPKIFTYFDHVTLVEPEQNKPLIKKPNLQFFKNYLKKNNLSPKQVIFIDDKQHNVEAARHVGMIAIRFTTPEQLRQNLNELGILAKR